MSVPLDMPRWLKATTLGCLIAFPVMVLAGRYLTTKPNAITRALFTSSALVQSSVAELGDRVRNLSSRYLYLIGVEKDNERLRRENKKLRNAAIVSAQAMRELQRYKRLLGFKQRMRLQTVAARVIARHNEPNQRSLRARTEDTRKASLVQVGAAVATADGAIGRITRVIGNFFDFRLLVDPKSAVDVRVQRSGERGILRGVTGARSGMARIDYLSGNGDIRRGDTVVTSGIAGVFPPGLRVGLVASVKKSKSNLYADVEVEPTVDYGALEDVLVLRPNTLDSQKLAVFGDKRGILR